MGMAHLHCSELKLKYLKLLTDSLGYNKLLHNVLNTWLRDIKMAQIHTIQGGVGFNAFTGVAMSGYLRSVPSSNRAVLL